MKEDCWDVEGFRELQRLTAVLALGCTLACSPDQVVTRIPADHARLQAIATVYAYACRDLGRPPKEAAELYPVFRQAGVDKPHQQLSSTRDGQPFVIIWGVDLNGKHLGSELPLAYERTGVGEVRLLVTCTGDVREVTAEEFSGLQWPAGHEPGSDDL